MARVYADQWGVYNGLYYSSWEVNPPNPTGYAPQMAITCMNDPGPTPRRNALGQYLNGANVVVATPEQADQITDASYNPAYSNFCYEMPFMPGTTMYMDTPVIPTQAFADGYNLPDSEYPDGTPAVDSVIGDVAGPWVSAANRTITIKCLGFANGCNKSVQNPDFSGPGATTVPYNQKWITRHYGFGSGGTVTIGGTPATCSQWTDAQLTCAVPAIPSTLTNGVGSTCYSGTSATPGAGQTPVQRNIPAANRSAYRCGELVITKSDGKRSIDAVTVTIAGTRLATPTVVTPSTTISGTFGAVLPNPLQTAIDNATPGDLIIVAPGTYKERLIMWKPVRLQGCRPRLGPDRRGCTSGRCPELVAAADELRVRPLRQRRAGQRGHEGDFVRSDGQRLYMPEQHVPDWRPPAVRADRELRRGRQRQPGRGADRADAAWVPMKAPASRSSVAE